MAQTNEKIRVMLVDDHDMVRQGLAIFIQTVEDLELVGEANNGRAAIELCRQVKPNVILMDLMMPDIDGVEATRLIRAEFPNIQVVALTSFKDKELVQRALKAGAIGYILKNVSIEDLGHIIRAAHAGKPTLVPEATQALIEIAADHNNSANFNLTERERQVLRLLVEGMTNPQIAEQLSLSRFTIKAYVSDILSKLGASNRSEAVAIALQNNLLSH